jgi:hypothetical protein
MVSPKSIRSVMLPGFVVSLASACTHVAPIVGVSPTRSVQGVELVVSGDSCDEEQEPDWYGSNLTELVLEVRVTNPTQQAITVQRDEIRLRTPDGVSLNTLTWGAASPLTIATGEAKSFQVRFMDRGSLHCGTKVELDTSGSVTASGHPLSTDGIRFTASGPRPIRL